MREIFRREIRREKLAQNALLYTTCFYQNLECVIVKTLDF